jgi:hypothetical protein
MSPRLKRLNGWQRIAVVLSVVWALYGAYWGNDYGLHQGDWVQFVYESCFDNAQKKAADEHYSQPAQEQYGKDIASCDRSRDRDWRSSIQYHFQYAAICAFVPIPLAWGLAYGLIALVRWIRKGFTVSTDSDLPPPTH